MKLGEGGLETSLLLRAKTAGCVLVLLQAFTRPARARMAPSVSERICAAAPGARWLLNCHLRSTARASSSLTTGTLNLSIAKLLASALFRRLLAICVFVGYLSKKQLRARLLALQSCQRSGDADMSYWLRARSLLLLLGAFFYAIFWMALLGRLSIGRQTE